MNKIGKPKNVAGSGGIGVIFGFALGVLAYIAIKTFYFKTAESLTSTFTILTTVLIIGFVGFMDDLLGWQRGGLSKRSRIILLICGAVPLMVINAGDSNMLGIELGIIYPLLFIPLGVVGVSTTYNFLAGYNGLESSQGIIILSALAFVTWKTGSSWLAIIALIMVSSLLAFYFFNKNPSKIFPGDIMTYSVGALIASITIIGNIEKIAVFFFIPYIIEVILKLRGKLKKHSFAKVKEDGSLDEPYEKIYGVEHLAIRILKKIKSSGKVYENEVVYIINGFQALVIVIGILLFL